MLPLSLWLLINMWPTNYSRCHGPSCDWRAGAKPLSQAPLHMRGWTVTLTNLPRAHLSQGSSQSGGGDCHSVQEIRACRGLIPTQLSAISPCYSGFYLRMTGKKYIKCDKLFLCYLYLVISCSGEHEKVKPLHLNYRKPIFPAKKVQKLSNKIKPTTEIILVFCCVFFLNLAQFSFVKLSSFHFCHVLTNSVAFLHLGASRDWRDRLHKYPKWASWQMFFPPFFLRSTDASARSCDEVWCEN